MQLNIVVMCSSLLLVQAACCAAEPAVAVDEASRNVLTAQNLLRRASKLVEGQQTSQRYKARVTLGEISKLQVRAGDFAGALESIRAYDYDYERDGGMVHIAEELAGEGKRQESLDVLTGLGSEHGWTQAYLNDGVRLRWIDYLLSKSDFVAAKKEVKELEIMEYQFKGEAKLAKAEANRYENAKPNVEAKAAEPITEQDLENKTRVAEKIPNPTRKASAMLKVATAYARLGNKQAALDLAAKIDLKSKSMLLALEGSPSFDFQEPGTWSLNYDRGDGFTMASARASERVTTELAYCAMTLAQTLPLDSQPNYAEIFNHLRPGSPYSALARAHAEWGNVDQALAWAESVGSEQKVVDTDDYELEWALERRIDALVGVAEGLLDRRDKDKGRAMP